MIILPKGQMNMDLKMSPFKAEVVKQAQKQMPELVFGDLTRLYEIVMDENEGFDGEPIESELMVKFMFARYKAVGLIPSRN